MILWRISKHASLNGAGGLVVSGRWHTAGKPVVYCAPNPATSVLEVLVHMEIDPEFPPLDFYLLKIEAPNSPSPESPSPISPSPPGASIERLEPTRFLKQERVTQRLGDAWLQSRRTLLLEVPSMVVPETWNYVLNPLHPEAALLKIAKIYKHPFDPRLF